MKRYVIAILIFFMGLAACAYPSIPPTTAQIAVEAEKANKLSSADNVQVRVGIGSESFGSYVYKTIGIYGTAPLDIYNNNILIDKVPANINVNVTINSDNSYTLTKDDGTEISRITGSLKFNSNGGYLGVKNLKRAGKPALYRGIFEIVKAGGGNQFNLVNQLDVEEYLQGVVPNEMPVSFGLDALKAQSIAARNYVLSPRAKSSPNYDVVDSVASQVYFGVNTEKELSNQAVTQTEGLVALYNWDLILAQYSSTAGGYTESYSNAFSDPKTKAFPSAEKPYLKAKADILSQKPLYGEEEAAAFYKSKPDSYDMRSPYFRWTREWNAEELKNVLENTLVAQSATGFISPVFNKGDTLDDLVELKVKKRGESGKIIEMEIITKSCTYKVLKELVIRRLLTKDGKALPSANVVFENAQDNEGNLVSVKAYGGGFGHGVGMSQFGAGFMGSELKLPFHKILQHYYTGISITTKPVIISTHPTQVSAVQSFYAMNQNAKIIIDNKYGVNQLSVNINGKDYIFNLPKELFGYKRYCQIDISQYIRPGRNIIKYTSGEFTGSSYSKALRLYVELVEPIVNESIW